MEPALPQLQILYMAAHCTAYSLARFRVFRGENCGTTCQNALAQETTISVAPEYGGPGCKSQLRETMRTTK